MNISTYAATVTFNGYAVSSTDVDQKALSEWVGRVMAAFTAESNLLPTTLCKVTYLQGTLR